MASDVAHKIRSNEPFYLGVTTAGVDKFGNKQRIIESGASTNGNLPNQFTKITVTDSQLATKLTARFDDARYYTGDATT